MMRFLTQKEMGLLEALLLRAGIYDSYSETIGSWLVEDMDDGGMGSIRLHRPDVLLEDTRLDRKASELQFRDVDGILVIATLNLNIGGFPFELDIWKVNSEPLKVIPDPKDFSDVEYTRIG